MDNTDIWEYVKSLPGKEDVRARHCRGCKYLGCCGHWVCCNYILITEKRRPGEFGQPNCPVKKYIHGYVPSEEYLQWVRQMDDQAAAEEKKRAVRKDAPGAQHDTVPVQRKKGRPLTWDVDYAKRLFCKGYYVREIAEIMGVPEHRVKDAAFQRWWGLDRKKIVKLAHDGNLEAEKRAFREYMEKVGNKKLHNYNTKRRVGK